MQNSFIRLFAFLGAVIIAGNIYAQNKKQSLDTYPVKVACLNLSLLKDKYVINSEKEFHDNFYNKTSPHPSCASVNYPDIDFSKRTLVGYRYAFEGCKPPVISIKVYKEDEVTIYEMSFKEYGNCRALYQGIKWYSIPKTNTDNIKFKFVKLEL